MKKKTPAKKAAPKKAAAQETSARTREKAEAYRKTGAVYLQKGKVGSKAKYNSDSLLMSANDLGGRRGNTSKEYTFGDEYGNITGGLVKFSLIGLYMILSFVCSPLIGQVKNTFSNFFHVAVAV